MYFAQPSFCIFEWCVSLSECSCNEKGTEGGTKCEHDSIGNCRCQESAQGQECGECKDGFYGFGTNSLTTCKGKTNLSLKGRDVIRFQNPGG